MTATPAQAPAKKSYNRCYELDENILKIPRFSGTQDVNDFFKKFELVCDAKAISDAEREKWLPLYLAGPAMLFFESLPLKPGTQSKGTIAELKTAIIQQFENLENKAVRLAKLHKTK